jgi:hypothetical protein
MVMSNRKSHLKLDWIVIILELTYGISILMQIFFIIPGIKAAIALLLFVFFAHIIRFKLNFPVFSKIPRSFLLSIFFIILLLDVIQSAFFANSLQKTGLVTCLAFNHLLFVSYLYNLYKETGSFSYVLKPYVGYSLYNVAVIMITAVLILIGLSWQQNMLTNDIHILGDNIEGGAKYYFPYFLSIAADYHPFRIFSQLPGLSGLSHEPHIIMWIITPPLIMTLLFKSRKNFKIILILIYIFIAMNSMSTINVACILVVLVFQAIWMAFNAKGRKYLFLLCAFLAIVLIAGYEFIDIIYLQSVSKFESSGSMDYTSDMITYITSWSSVFGHGNFPPSTGTYKIGESAGILTSLLDVTLYVSLVYKSIRLMFSTSNDKHYFGLGFLYFLLHGLKVNYLVFSYPFFTYLLFLMSLTSDKNIRLGSDVIDNNKSV